MQKILVIEDEELMRSSLLELLNSSGYEGAALTQDELQSLSSIIDRISDLAPDLILLDITLPQVNGELILKALRAQSNLPVIMITSLSTEKDEILSMSYGADDYITKPYSPQVLLLRIAAVLKRSENTKSRLQFKNLVIDLARGVISSPEKRLSLTKNEMIIIGHLLKHQGKIVTRDALMTDLWNNHEYINDNALTVSVSRLRSKLTTLGFPNAIETRKGLGYVLS